MHGRRSGEENGDSGLARELVAPRRATTGPVPLTRLVERVGPIAVLGDPSQVVIGDIVLRDDAVTPGALYCCIPGDRVDGHDFAGRAVELGAVALVCEHSVIGARDAVQLVVGPGEARTAMARAACEFFGDPASALRTVGVTGTNGKTTTTYLVRSIFERGGWPTGIVGTLDGPRTTPESPDLQRSLADFRDGGRVAAALEVTSHALVQGRVDGICFDVAVFTNLSQDHLDYHATMDAYFAAKSLLFEPERSRVAVVNLGDPYGRRLAERRRSDVIGYSLADAHDLELGPTWSRFELAGEPVEIRLGGVFNVENALAAAAAARALGIADEVIAAGLNAAGGVPGRFETIESLDGVTVVVDFAHTPAALEQLLVAARRLLGSADAYDATRTARTPQLFVVFGAGGDRDQGKRPAMGAVAARLADVVVLTSDNPRREDPATIAAQIKAGVAATGDCRVELDRQAAIVGAIRAARRGDVVVVAGKGHETTQQIGDTVVHLDDREVVRDALVAQGRALPVWSTRASGREAS